MLAGKQLGFINHHLATILLFLLLPVIGQASPTKPSAAAIASAHPLATAAGEKILRQGGNAFDAAVAVTAALAVVEPSGSGLGGGGFYLLHEAGKNRTVMLDAREKAPLDAHRDMYLNAHGEPIRHASLNGPLAAGIPGIPAALEHLAKHYGNLPLSSSLAPAITYANNGFEISKRYRSKLKWRLKSIKQFPTAAAIFLDNHQVPKPGWVLKQADLAATLTLLANKGGKAFYHGDFAQKLVKEVGENGGIWQIEDLKKYTIVEREPVRTIYRGITVTSAAPPSSGGIALATMLNILKEYDLQHIPTVKRIHLIVEAMRRAYRDRAIYLGDPDFTTIPLNRLTHPYYAAGLRAAIHPDKATPSHALLGEHLGQTGEDTSHFSVIDTDGNRVAATLSINLPFGSGYVAEGTGVLLNNEMDDFSIKPGTPNAYGLIGAEANAIAPEKRPLSSMSPTFLETKNRVALLGTPGGSRIITMVLHGILAFSEDKPVTNWVAQPRYHHQFLPDHIQYEKDAFSKNTLHQLQRLGHKLKPINRHYGDMQAILWEKPANRVTAASDPRGVGSVSIIDK